MMLPVAAASSPAVAPRHAPEAGPLRLRTGPCATLRAVTDDRPAPIRPAPGDPSGRAGLTPEDLVAATGGSLLRRGGRLMRGAAVDSRLVGPGELFVALHGERTDGHRFR